MQVMAFYHKKEATLQDKMTSLMSSALAGMKLSPIILVQHTDGIVLVSFLMHRIAFRILQHVEVVLLLLPAV